MKKGNAVNGLIHWLDRTGWGGGFKEPHGAREGRQILGKRIFFGCIAVPETAPASPGISSALRKGPEANWGQKVDTL